MAANDAWGVVPEPAPAPPARVQFGAKPGQAVDLPVAESILRQFCERFPVLFGQMLAEALVGPEARKQPRNRRPAE